MFWFVAAMLMTGCGDSTTEAMLVQQGCDGGDVTACYEMGIKVLEANRSDYSHARDLFNRGCIKHHPGSCYELARLVKAGHGGPKDPKRAANYFEISCEAGLQEACVAYGLALYAGDGIEPQPEKAVELLTSACEGDKSIPSACTALGLAFDAGQGVRRDRKRAVELYEKACAANDAPGCVAAGASFEKLGGRTNYAKAVKAYEAGCKIDARFGCYDLAEMHQRKRAPEWSYDAARYNYMLSCNVDARFGCYEVARLIEAGHIQGREGEKEILYIKACEVGHDDACRRR